MENNNIVDFGEINIPTQWSDITLKQYQELQKARDNDNNIITIISILSNKDENTIRTMPAMFTTELMQKITFLGTMPKINPSDKFRQYQVNPLEVMTFGEWMDCNMAIGNDKTDYATILAILCRLPNEQYNQDYINNKFEERKNMFEQAPVTEILPVALFFSTCSIVSQMILQGSLNQRFTREKSIVQKKNNSKKRGVSNKVFTFLRKKMSRKSRKS